MEGAAVVTVQEPQKHRAMGDKVLAILGGQAATFDPAITCRTESEFQPSFRNAVSLYRADSLPHLGCSGNIRQSNIGSDDGARRKPPPAVAKRTTKSVLS